MLSENKIKQVSLKYKSVFWGIWLFWTGSESIYQLFFLYDICNSIYKIYYIYFHNLFPIILGDSLTGVAVFAFSAKKIQTACSSSGPFKPICITKSMENKDLIS